ncbi:MAG: ABC transporter ATP-binding protein, partial [Pseudomonadota bacterium]
GLMFQDFALFPHLSLMENVGFGLRHLARADAAQTASAALARVGLAHLADAYPDTLSGGEQQRVALARAIAPRPAVLLMDEPFSGLDVKLRENMQNETLAVLRETRATSMIVTHDPEEAMRMADRIAVMDRGRVVQVGTADELYHHPATLFVARFFSDMNELPCRVVDGVLENPMVATPVAAPPACADAIMCVRERGVELLPEGEGVPGRIIDASFLGDSALLELAVQGVDQPVMARVNEADAPAIGSTIGVRVPASAVLTFPA